jgi:hypothetical protein
MKSPHRHHQQLYQQLWIEVLTWVVAEITLSWVGLDHIANYGEFIQDARSKARIAQVATAAATQAIGTPLMHGQFMPE